jgi:hypothetical protein
MPFKAALPALKNAYYRLFSSAGTLPTFKDVVPTGTTGTYVLISGETSGQSEYNNSAFLQTAVIRVEIILKAFTIPNPSVAELALTFLDNQLLPTPNTTNLSVSGFQITSVRVQSIDQLVEDDGSNPTFRYIIRYEHLLNQI